MLKNKNSNAKSTVMVCLIGAVVLMGILTGLMIERFNIKRDDKMGVR